MWVIKNFNINPKFYLVSTHDEHLSFRCYTVEAAMEFFGMDDIADTPTKNRPNYAFMTITEHKQKYFQETFDNFINEYVLGNDDADQSEPGYEWIHLHNAGANLVDNLRNYSRNDLQHFFLF